MNRRESGYAVKIGYFATAILFCAVGSWIVAGSPHRLREISHTKFLAREGPVIPVAVVAVVDPGFDIQKARSMAGYYVSGLSWRQSIPAKYRILSIGSRQIILC
jgi:hypothetical protein